MKSSLTASLSTYRATVRCALALVLCGLTLPTLAAPVRESGFQPILGDQLHDLTNQILAPSFVFAKNDGNGGGGGSGNSGTTNGKDDKKGGNDKQDKGDNKDKKEGKKEDDDKKDKKDKGDKKDKKDKKDQKDKGDKKDKKDQKDKGDTKDKKDQKDKGDKKDKKDKKDQKDKGDKKDKKDKKDGKKEDDDKKDQKDKGDKKDKKDKKDDKKEKDNGEDGGQSGGRNEQESRDDEHDHDRNERHEHDNETADGRHDHETEERQHEHRDNEDSSEKDQEKSAERDDEQGAEHEYEAGQSASSAEAGDDATAESEISSAQVSQEEPPADDANSESITTPGVVTLSWTPPVENEDGSALTDLAGYRVFWRETSWDHTESLQIDNPGLSRIVIEDLDAGTYEFAMTSLNSAGIESGLSNSVTRIVEGPTNSDDGVAKSPAPETPTTPTETEPTDSGGPADEPPPYLMISGTPPEAVTAGELYLFTPVIESSGDTPPAFAIEGLPHWAGFDEVSGELYGTPDFADLGLYGTITISATDGVVETSLPPFSIEVVAPGAAMGAVTLSWTPPAENEDGTYLVDLAGYWIYWGNNPGTYTEWLRIDNPGLTMVVIEDLVPGDWEFAMTSFNEDGVESKLSNTVTRFVE